MLKVFFFILTLLSVLTILSNLVKLSPSEKEVPLDPRFELLNNLPKCGAPRNSSIQGKLEVNKLVDEFLECVTPIIEEWRNDTEAINERWEETEKCDSVFANVPITFMKNIDEKKYVILPNCKEENIMVTLGIGHDTMAEEQLNRTLPNTMFFGADAIIDPNRELYSKFGKFFPFAIGSEPGIQTFFVLPKNKKGERVYQHQDVVTIPFTYFLGDILKLKKIDIAWIDIEGGELQFLNTLHRGEELDKKGVTICQFNMEVHSKFFPHLAVAYHDFIFRVLDEKRYVFLKPSRTAPGVHTMYFINVENKECVAKYLQ